MRARKQKAEAEGAYSQKEKELRNSLLLQVANIPGGESIKKCIQCGSCTGSCPVSYTMDITPREIIALFRARDIESILSSRTIWICASCYACTIRCPQGVQVTDILYALKRLAIEQKIFPKRFPVYSLSKSFVYLANRYGRSYEPGLIVAYFLKTNPFKLLGMIPLFLKLFFKGRIGILPKKIKGSKNFSKILQEAEIMEMVVPVVES
ncbi:MAG: 4Fe-4S dicluster domain-containing protein [Candidatus Aminicenantes bacterium]|nr:4Fe-4S dicluster domain-containing protein [Candidatus Aminicenantes bacterium]MDH5705924.1 4Fe-4S dicluster domain-containing protein [Candidatus Aminicenantes bacterium]